MADDTGPLLSRATDRSSTAWKNGGGSTSEIASSPAGSGIDDFDWRVSIATIAASADVAVSEFSTFEGVDRWLMPLTPDGLTLVNNGTTRALAAFDVLSFPGENAVSAIEVAAESRDLNLMVRRGIRSGSLEKRSVIGSAVLTTDDATELIVVVLDGTLDLPDRLVAGDALVLGPDDFLMLSGTATIAVATVS